MRHKKLKNLETYYNKPADTLIREWYVDGQLSSTMIAEKIVKETGIPVTPRGIQYTLKRLGISRDKSVARKIGIIKGRVNYDLLRKPIKSKEFRKGISLKVRYGILKRDNFRCVLCGQNASKSQLVIDHIIPISKGGTNEVSNLRTVCRECNHGKMIHENEK